MDDRPNLPHMPHDDMVVALPETIIVNDPPAMREAAKAHGASH